MTTLKGARADLATRITTAVADSTVTVLSYDPPTVSGDTVTVATAGISPTEWRLTVRVYVDAVQSAEGQDRADDIAEAVDLAPGLSDIPRSNWEAGFDQAKEAFLMSTTVDYPREDF